MKRTISWVLCLALLLTIPALGAVAEEAPAAEAPAAEAPATDGFTAEELTLRAFIDAMYAEHEKRHALTSGRYDLGNDIAAHVTYPEGRNMTLMSCILYEDNNPRDIPGSTKDINELFRQLFLVEQALSMEQTAHYPLDLEKFEQRYGGNVYLGVAQKGWWRQETSDVDMLLMVPIMITDAKKAPIEDTIYILCITLTEQGTRMWLCAESYLAYTMLTAAMPEKVKAKDEFKIWWDGQEDYRLGVAEDPASEAARRLDYAAAMNAMWAAQ